MIVIRFDGPPGPIAGRFVDIERDGVSIRFGEWKKDGDDWILELTEIDRLEESVAAWKLNAEINAETCDEYRIKIIQLEAEVERLRGVLGVIADYSNSPRPAKDTARDALEVGDK